MLAHLLRRAAAWIGGLLPSRHRPIRQLNRSRPRLETLEDRLAPASVWWDGGGDNLNWFDHLNWNTDTLPTSADHVDLIHGQPVLLNGSATVLSLNSMGPLSVQGSLELGGYSVIYGDFDLSGDLILVPGATLGLSGGGDIDGAIHLGAGSALEVASDWSPLRLLDGSSVTGPGTVRFASWGNPLLEVSGQATVDHLILGGGGILQGAGTLEIVETMTWTGGTMKGSGTTLIGPDAVLTIPDGYNMLSLQDGRTLRNEGTVEWEGGNTISTWSGTARYENAAGAVWKMGGNGTLSAMAGSGVVFENEGLLAKTGTVGMMGDATRFEGVFLVSSGELEIEEGTLCLQNGGELGNSILLAIGNTRLELPEGTISLLPGLVVSGPGMLAIGTDEDGEPTTQVTGNVTATNVELRSGSISGSGTLDITGDFHWLYGDLTGSGTTIIRGTATLTGNQGRFINDRTLTNYGTITWDVGSATWGLGGNARLENFNQFTINANIDHAVLSGGIGTPLITNHGQITKTGPRTLRFSEPAFIHKGSGSILVQEGRLFFDRLEGTFSGFMQANAGTQVLFSNQLGQYTLSPNLDDGPVDLLRGAGRYIFTHGAEVTIPGGDLVEADYVELSHFRFNDDSFEPFGDGVHAVLKGEGTLAIQSSLNWTGGFMQSETQSGTTEIRASATMLIEQVEPRLDRWRLFNFGTINWMPLSNNIIMANESTIVNDGGRFNIFVDNKTIENEDNSAGPIILRNGGTFYRGTTEYLGNVTIEPTFSNDGGWLIAKGNLTFTRQYIQNGDSETVFSGGVYTSANGVGIRSGELKLQGGELVVGGNEWNGVVLGGIGAGSGPTHFQGRGTIDGTLHVVRPTARADLTGNLTMTAHFFQTNGETHLNGNILTATGNPIIVPIDIGGGTLFLNGGVLRATGTLGIYNSGTIRGNGTIDAPRFEHRAGGQLIIGNLGAAGTVTITGNLFLSAGSLLRFEIGGTQAGVTYDHLIVQGNARFAGNIEVTLINGFIPSAEPEPDEFALISFVTSEGTFNTTTIDIGNGLHLDISYRMTSVVFVTDDE